jgi:hypothetical protein
VEASVGQQVFSFFNLITADSMSQWIGKLLRLENVQSIDGWSASFAARWAEQNPGVVWLLCGLAVALAVWFYVRFQVTNRPALRVVAATCRALCLALIVLLLADPVLRIRFINEPKPLLWVLFDGTESMAIEDELATDERAALDVATGLSTNNGTTVGKRPRVDYVKAWVEKTQDNTLLQLAERFRLRGFTFENAEGVRPLDWSVPGSESPDVTKAGAALSTNGQVTALGRALEDLSLRHSATHLQGVIVVSDFDQNAGPAAVPLAAKLGVPVYTVGVGPVAAVDLAVDLQAPPVMKKSERTSLVVTLRQTGLEGETAQLTVTARQTGSDGLSSASEIAVGQRAVTLNEPTTTLEVPFTPEQVGRFEFTAVVAPLEGEIVEQNNRASRDVTIRDDFLRLLFVEYEPTWEWRFIKEVFHRDKLVGMRGFRTFLRSADPKVRGTNELFLPTLTPSRAEFFANDVIFLGDMPASALSSRFCEMTKEFVEKFGGGLVVIAGRQFGPAQLAETPLADLLPVVVTDESRPRDAQPFQLRRTAEAGFVDFMQLGGSESENDKAWKNLGELPWYQPVARPHPLASVLAEHPSDVCADGKTPQPIIAIRRYGRGEVVYVGLNETWRMRAKHGEMYYRQLWGQMIHRLGLSHALGSQKRFVVRTDRPQYQMDEVVQITAEAFDANFEPLAAEKLPQRTLTGQLDLPREANPSVESQPVTLTQLREGVFEAQVPVTAGGEYRLRVKDPITREESQVSFRVASLSAERRSAVRNVALQQALAQETGGMAYDLTTASRLVQDVKFRPQPEQSVKVFSLAMTWLCFGTVVALLLGEWLVRKAMNLP